MAQTSGTLIADTPPDLLAPPARIAEEPAHTISEGIERPAPQPLPMIQLMGVELHSVTEAQAIGHIIEQLEHSNGGVTITPNLDHIRRCRSDMQFASLVAEAELVVADGMPLIWASRVAGCPLPERVAGSDLILTLSAAAANAGRSIFLLGGAPGTAEGAAEVLRHRHPNIRIVGTYCPPIGFEENEREMAALVATLTAAKPDIIFVALGSPKQEHLIERIRTTLPQAWWLGVGISFSFLTGQVQRAPRWVQALGLEWAHRLIQEPRRLFKRYVMQGIPFAATLLTHAASQRLGRLITNSPPRCHSRPNRTARALLAASTAAADAEESTAAGLGSSLAPKPWSAGGRGTRGIGEASALQRLKAVVLLSGQLRPSPLMQAVGRSVLDLPIEDGKTLLAHWINDVNHLRAHAKLHRLPVRVLVSRPQDQPSTTPPTADVDLSIETDASELRGTAGVLSDITRDYGDDDFILVANASQLLLEPLSVLATTLDNKRSDVALVNHVDGMPGGLQLIRCATLRKVKSVGFIDLKEQALPTIARDFDVRVVHCNRPTGLTLRTTTDYIGALRRYYRGLGRVTGSRRGQLDPLAEEAGAGFSIVESGAWVHASAYLHDAVVLRGARVEAGAIVVRSLVGSNAQLRRDAKLIDGFAG